MIHVFYRKETGQIFGFSEQADAFEHPYIDTDTVPIVLSNYYVDVKAETPELKLVSESFTPEQWEEIVNPKPITIVAEMEITDEEAEQIKNGQI